MSRDKRRSLARRVTMLKMIGDRSTVEIGGSIINHLGGIGFRHPELQRLLNDGHVRLKSGSPYPPKKFAARFLTFVRRNPFGVHGMNCRTRAVITESGQAFLKRHAKSVRPIIGYVGGEDYDLDKYSRPKGLW